MSNVVSNSFSSTSETHQPLGEILIEAGLISAYQVEQALKEQKQVKLKIGTILAINGWIKQETVDFFAERWSTLIEESPKRPLVYYFREAGLLSEEQITALKTEQQKRAKKIRFHYLAVEQGYIKQTTVDFFLEQLIKTSSFKSLDFGKLHKILKDYVYGRTNFKGSELSKAPLMEVNLKGIELDGSNLKKANLRKGDLSQASLTWANLSQANLSQAVLVGVDFERACLTYANLRESNLEGTSFKQANLQGADLTNSNLEQASFVGADLRMAILPLQRYDAVYYDFRTRFAPGFDPQSLGWKKIG